MFYKHLIEMHDLSIHFYGCRFEYIEHNVMAQDQIFKSGG